MRPKNSSTIQTALKQAVSLLKKAKIDSAWLDAELLLAFVLKKRRAFVLAHGEKKLTTLQVKRFFNLIKQRGRNMPVAYLTGHKEFYGLDFKITKNTLVPRPASEELVEKALKILNKNSKTIIIDIGTGSGCLIISVLKNIKKPHQAFGIDISKKALAIAKQNTKKHGVKIDFYQGDLLKPIMEKIKKHDQLVIIANLPYLNKQEMKEPSISQEPKLALYGGQDGLKYYRRLAKQIEELKKAKNISITLIAEISSWQKKKFKQIWPN